MVVVRVAWAMRWGKHIAPVAKLAWACAVLMLIACHSSPASAEPAPPKTCAAISSQEYAAAKKQKLLRSQFGSYVRTGGLGRRQYWYCHA
jgi:hypothetical protein